MYKDIQSPKNQKQNRDQTHLNQSTLPAITEKQNSTKPHKQHLKTRRKTRKYSSLGGHIRQL
jgi:hypothetical protein